MAHRGPDAEGFFSEGDAGWRLAHRRLAVIDPAAASDQPFHSACGRYVAVYNGEVYNFRELANKHALALRTRSDTEVVTELFARLGPDFVTELNGMFALAVYDRREDAVHLFRDRLGIKPLYLYENDGAVAFASELPALLAALPPQERDEAATGEFLHRGYVPEPRTWYKDIQKFPAGHCAVIRGGKVSFEKYWAAEDHITAEVHSDEDGVIDRLHEMIREAVRLRLVADVPFGSFLSGGADSGLISAVAAEVHNAPLNTFNISFEDAVFDESGYAREMAEAIGARHHHRVFGKRDILSAWEEGLRMVGEPFADSSIFPTSAVSAFASEHVKMALSGDGGDELFHGYGAYTWAERMSKPHFWHLRKGIATALRMRGGNRNRRAAEVFDAPDKAGLAAHIFSQEQNLFSAREITALTGRPYTDPYRTPRFSRKLTPAEEQAFFDLTNYLKDDLLVKMDRASMRHSLEVRVPFLDHRLVELALNIDPALKTKDGEAKYLLKKIMERYYPKTLIYRQKWGFSVPLEKWMREEDLLGQASQAAGMLADERDGLLKRYTASPGHAYLYNRIYALTAALPYV